MATYDWPAAFRPSAMEWGFSRGGTEFRSQYNGTRQAVEYISDRFIVSVSLPPCLHRDAGSREAFFGKLTGGFDWVRAWHFTRPVPEGTMRGSPTLASTVSRGASSLVIQTTAGATLKAGDLFKIGAQVFMAFENATANGSGVMTVNVVFRARGTINADTAVLWDKPTATFVIPEFTSRFAHQIAVLGRASFDLIEVWA